MNRCEKCGKFTYHNSHFGREVCPYCGWIESAKVVNNYRRVLLIKKDNRNQSLSLCKR